MIKRWKGFLFNSATAYTFMAIAASGINFVTLIVFGRIFSVDDYGVITTLQAFVANIAVFFTPLQFLVCKSLAENQEDKPKQVSNLLSILIVVNAAELVCLAAAARLICGYLNLLGVIDYVLFVVLIFANNIYLVISGVAQGRQDFNLLGWAGIILYATKMILGVFLGVCGFGPVAMVIGYIAAELVCLFVMIRKLHMVIKELLAEYRFQINMDILAKYIWMTALYVIVSLYLNNGDLLLINLYGGQVEIGLYSVAISLSKISVFLIATPIGTMLLPKISSNIGKDKVQKRLLLQAEGITLLASSAYGAAFYFLGGWIITLLYGEAYAGAGEYRLPCIIFSTVLSGFWIFYQYVLATDFMKRFTVIAVAFGGATVIGVVCTQCAIRWIPLLMAMAMVATVMISVISKRNVRHSAT